MKSRIFALLAVVLVLVTSLSIVGCGGGGAKFKVSGLTFSNPVEVNTVVTISATITNNGGASGIYNATLNVDGAIVGTQSVELAAKASQLVTFNYTPKTEGSFNVSITPGANVNINPDNVVKGTLGVIQPLTGYWDVKYALAEGSKVRFNYSLASYGGYLKVSNLSTGDGMVTIRVNKTVVNGAREIILLSSGWQIKSLNVKDISPGVDMDVVMALTKDATGKLYVQDGVGDVDMSSKSARTTKPKQTNTVGDGTKDPAGSMLVDAVLQGNAQVSVGTKVILPFGLTFTTGSITNTVLIPSSKFNGAVISSKGLAFAKDGPLKVADYVGTAGTITTTGTGDCLGLTLVGLGIDFQVEIKLVLQPVSVK